MRTRLAVGLVLLMAALTATAVAVAACGDGKHEVVDPPLPGVAEIEVVVEVSTGLFSQTTQVFLDPEVVPVGQVREVRVRIRNSGEGGRALCIGDPTLEMEYDAPGPEPDGGPAFAVSAPAEGRCLAPVGEGNDMDLPESYVLVVRFKRHDDRVPRRAVLTLPNDNSVDEAKRNYRIRLETTACEPSIDAPYVVDLGTVHDPTPEELGLGNAGTCPLEIRSFTLDGDPGFALVANGKEHLIEETPGEVLFVPPVVVPPGTAVDPPWEIRYAPANDDAAEARLTLFTNDAAFPAGRAIRVLANVSVVRLCVEPAPVEFGGKLPGKEAAIDVTIASCGATTLEIINIELRNGPGDNAEAYELRFDAMGGVASASLDPGATSVFTVARRTSASDGNPRNALVIHSNAFHSPLVVEVSGFGLPELCPQPVIGIDEGDEVWPQAVLHLHGEASVPSTGAIVSWVWTATAPAGGASVFVPSAAVAGPSYEVTVVGDYTFCLDACDPARCSSDPSCHTTSCVTVAVR